MKLPIIKSTVIALIVSSPLSVMAVDTTVQLETSSHPVEAIAQIPITGLRIATGAVAIPLMIVGEIGSISGQAGKKLWEQATHQNAESMQAADTKKPTNNNERFL